MSDSMLSLSDNVTSPTSSADLGVVDDGGTVAAAGEAAVVDEQTIETLLFERLGPRRQELAHAVTMTAIYSAIFVTGVIGNVSTCLVIAKCRYMRSATNYYLFNLAVADLLVLLLGLPQVGVILQSDSSLANVLVLSC